MNLLDAELSFRTLGSGSCGNMAIARCGLTKILIDAGLGSQRLIRERLAECGVEPREIRAALISHGHCDHLAFAGLKFCCDMGIPVLGQIDTLNKATEMMVNKTRRLPDHGILQVLAPGTRIVIGEIDVTTFFVPHDVPTMGFVLRPTGMEFPKVTVATDIGQTGDDLIGHFMDADAIFIESNYNEHMLRHSSRGLRDRHRVQSTTGHLGNIDAGRFIGRVYNLSARKPSVVTLMHLSDDHNTPACAIDDFRAACGLDSDCFHLHAAPRDAAGVIVSLPVLPAVSSDGQGGPSCR